MTFPNLFSSINLSRQTKDFKFAKFYGSMNGFGKIKDGLYGQNILLVNKFSKQKNPIDQYSGPDTKRRFAKISI